MTTIPLTLPNTLVAPSGNQYTVSSDIVYTSLIQQPHTRSHRSVLWILNEDLDTLIAQLQTIKQHNEERAAKKERERGIR